MTSLLNKLSQSSDALVEQQWQQEEPRQEDQSHCYVYFESSESDGGTLSTTSRTHSGSPSNERISDIFEKNKIAQETKGQNILKKRESCTLL